MTGSLAQKLLGKDARMVHVFQSNSLSPLILLALILYLFLLLPLPSPLLAFPSLLNPHSFQYHHSAPPALPNPPPDDLLLPSTLPNRSTRLTTPPTSPNPPTTLIYPSLLLTVHSLYFSEPFSHHPRPYCFPSFFLSAISNLLPRSRPLDLLPPHPSFLSVHFPYTSHSHPTFIVRFFTPFSFLSTLYSLSAPLVFPRRQRKGSEGITTDPTTRRTKRGHTEGLREAGTAKPRGAVGLFRHRVFSSPINIGPTGPDRRG